MTEYPIAYSVKIEPNPQYPGYYLWTVACPYCQSNHHHGGGEGGDQGHRVAHCGNKTPDNRGYVLVERDR
jgi:hypothetical protein